MKAQHRHELETNVLAKELNAWREKLRPYSSAIVTGLIVVLAAYALLSMWNARSASREKQAWLAYERAMLQGDVGLNGVQLAAASEDFAGSRMQEWAYLAWSDRQLRIAAEMYFRNREDANDRLDKVLSYYRNLAQQASDPEIRNRARLGLARVYEMQNKLDDARKEYAAVEGTLSMVAQARLNDLDARGDEVADAAAWLATAELPRPTAPTGLQGVPGARPGLGVDPPAVDSQPGLLEPIELEDIFGRAVDGEAGRYGEPSGESSADESTAEEPADAEQPADEQPAAESSGEDPAAQP